MRVAGWVDGTVVQGNTHLRLARPNVAAAASSLQSIDSTVRRLG